MNVRISYLMRLSVQRSKKPRRLMTKKAIRESGSGGTFGVRKRPWKWLPLLIAIPLLALVGVGAFVGYSYWEYRTFWGDPNIPPSDVTSFGSVETKTFYSEAVGQTMEYNIYLPPGYDDLRHRFITYPVVYLLHGRPGTDDDWVSKGGAADAMDTLLARGQVRPMIMVMPQGSTSRYARASGYADGLQGNWETYITRDLVNEIDSNYRTVVSARGRAIAGLSEGGYGAMNLGLRNPSEFGVIGSFSGYFTIDQHDLSSIFGGDQNLAEANSPMTYLPQLEGELPAIYFYVGEDDEKFLEENQEFADELETRGASYDFETYPGAHSWKSWRGHLPDFLTFATDRLKGGE
jgi:putative tributyrin esterase